MRASILALAAVLAVIGGPALSQGAGGNTESAGQFRNIAPTGVTKPPGAAAAPDAPLKPKDRRKKRRDGDSGIKGICIGCN